ncbi:hypothetical protein ACFQ8Q_27845 [Streptomyces cyaneofuscatus]|uniref:hypothetical protein n=2 Tax=Streptomyces TaxID=1883 RepID=UPI00368AB0E4
MTAGPGELSMMSNHSRGRSSPWARALGGLVGLLLLGMVALLVSQWLVQSARQDAAFGETRDLAERHAKRMTERSGESLADRRSLVLALDAEERSGRGISTLYAFVREGTTATEVVMYTQPYEKAALPLSSGMGTARRCFTIVYSAVGTPKTTAAVTAHERKVSCVRVAEEVDGTDP